MTELPQSAYLSLSIRRSISAAQQRSHRYVTLEHLLLSLLDDPDALALLEGVRADIAAIKVSAADTVNRNLATLYTPGQFDLRASYKVERVLQTASDDADRLNCQEVDAAFVLAAISRESDNPAADILTRNGFTYSAAMTWLYTNRGKSTGGRLAPAASTPAPSASPAPSEAASPKPAPLPAREGTGLSERLAAGEDEYSDLELEELGEAEPEPKAKPGREGPQAPPPAAAARTAPQPAPAKPQVSAPPPFFDDDDDEDLYQDGRYSAPSSPQPFPQSRQREAGEGGGYAPTPAPTPVPRRPESQVPSSTRLDQMRVRPGASRPPQPAPPPPASASAPQPAAKQAKKRPLPTPAPAPAPAKGGAPDRAKGRPKTRRPGPYDALLGRLVENIPRRMCSAVAERVEVRISREDSVALGRGMEGRAETIRHDIMVTQAMSVMLRAPDGGFVIEPLSPETQWIFERPETASEGETYGRWRWVVTPGETGQRRLQLIIAARSIDKNGLVGDTALPDQVITVRVRMNILRSLGRGIQWLAAMILGGVLTELTLIGMRIFEKTPPG